MYVTNKTCNFYSIFSQVPKTFSSTVVQYCTTAGRSLEASWRCCHSSSGFSLSQVVLFLHVIPDRLDDDQIKSLCGALAVVRHSLDYYN